MERIIKLADIQAAVDAAYENNKTIKEGQVDTAFGNADEKDFGIAVALTDGTLITKGDSKKQFTLGSLVKVPLSVVLFNQNGVNGLVKKSGQMCCCHKSDVKKPEVPVSAHGVRAVSAVEPVGDREGKMMVISDMINSMINGEVGFNDDVYKAHVKACDDAKAVDAFAADGYYLYDDAALSIDIYNRLQSMTLDAEQLAELGATVAADGRNAAGEYVFDGKLSQDVVAMMAAHGPHKVNKVWLVKAGIPAKSGRGGGFLAILPGVMAIAAYSPALNEAGIGIKAAKSVAEIANKLDLNVFASAKVKVEK